MLQIILFFLSRALSSGRRRPQGHHTGPSRLVLRKMGRQGCIVTLLALFMPVARCAWWSRFYKQRPSSSIASSTFNVSDSEAIHALVRIGNKIHGPVHDGYRAGGSMVRPSASCHLTPFGGTGYGLHHVCNRTYPRPCVTLTYGVQVSLTHGV